MENPPFDPDFVGDAAGGSPKRLWEAIDQVGRTIAAELELNRLVQAITDASTSLIGAAFGAFFYNVLDEKGESYSLYTLSGVPREAFAKFPMPRNTTLFGPTFRGEGVVRIDDVTKDPRYGQTGPHYGMPSGHLAVCSYLAVSVISRGGEVLGGLFFGHPQPSRFTQEHEHALVGVARYAAIAIENARLYERARRGEVANAELAAIVQSSDDAIVSKDLEGIIRSWNAGAERMFGYTKTEIVGRSITLLIPPERPDEESNILARLRRGEKIDHFETVRIRKDGQRIDVSVTISPIRDSAGNLIGASKVARDITERKRSEAERERLLAAERAARTDAERHSRMKDEFLATLGHELRTPLNAVLGWATLLKRNQTQSPETLHGLEVIERNARLQGQLIEDLLDMSRIIAGKLRLNVQRVDLTTVVDAALEAIGPAAEAKQVRLERVLDPLAGPVSGDPNRLQQIVWNLLSNSVKFTPKGGKVQILLERVNSHVELSVTDTGQGIAPEFLPHVFDRFRQADPSTTRQHGGLGLGLAIVKHLTELHGGSVRAKSAGVGQGATFMVSLPVRAAHSQNHEPPADRPADLDPFREISLAGLRALVVDDEVDARDLIRRLLEAVNMTVQTASSVEEALGLVSANPPHILISDIGMPGQDGYALIRQLRAMPKENGGSIPAVALTAFARPEDRRHALLAGFQMHVAKPVEAAELLAVIASVTKRV